MGVLEDADEKRGRQNAIYGIIPAAQCFKAADPSAQSPDHRLIPGLDISAFEGFIEMIQNIALQLLALGNIIIVDGDIMIILIVNAPGSEACMVDHERDVCVRGTVLKIDAGLQLQTHVFLQRMHKDMEMLDFVRDILAAGQHGELIR